MKGVDVRAWRNSFGLSQQELADKIGMTRNTVQNWEAQAGDLSGPIENHLKIWDRKLRQEEPLRGPVSLIYADGPMVVRPSGRTAMLKVEDHISNAAAIARAQALSASPNFHGLFVVQGDREDLWNMAELSQAISGRNPDAPTMKSILLRLSAAIRRDAPNYVRSGPALASDRELKKRVAELKALAEVLEDIACAAPVEVVSRRGDVDQILAKVRSLGLRPNDVLVSAWAQACHGFLMPTPA